MGWPLDDQRSNSDCGIMGLGRNEFLAGIKEPGDQRAWRSLGTDVLRYFSCDFMFMPWQKSYQSGCAVVATVSAARACTYIVRH